MLHPPKINKTGEGLALNVIVIAAMVLIVLVVLIAIFSSRIGFYGKSLDSCPGGDTKPNQDSCGEDKVAVKLRNSNEYCCIDTNPKTKNP